MKKKLIFMCVFFIALFALAINVNAVEVTEIHLNTFEYLLEGPIPNNNHVWAGYGENDNPFSDYIWGFYDYSSATETAFIKYDESTKNWVVLGANDTLVADGRTHYGVRISIGFKNGGDFTENLAVYLNDDYEHPENNKNYTTYGYTKILRYNSNDVVAIMYLDLGPAEEAVDITFETNGGTAVNSQHIRRGDTLEGFENPQKEGFMFYGWYTDQALTKEFDVDNEPVDKDMTLYAKYVVPIPIKAVNIDFELPECGTIIEADLNNGIQDPQLEFIIENGEHYYVYQLTEHMQMIWYDDSEGFTHLDGVEIEEEKEYKILFYIMADKGYYFSDDVVVKINGEEQIDLLDFATDRTGIETGYTFTTPKTHTITLDFNGGTNKTFELPGLVWEGTSFEVGAPNEDEIVPPEGKIFDAFEVNGKRVEVGETITVTEDWNAKILWKDKITTYSNQGSGVSIEFDDVADKNFVFNIVDLKDLTDEDIAALDGTREEVDDIINKVLIATKDDGTLLALYAIVINDVDANEELHTVDGGFKIKILMTDEMKQYDIFKMIYIDDDYNEEEPIIFTVEGDYLVGTLKHLSGYALVGSKSEEVETEETVKTSNPATGDNIISSVVLFMISALGFIIIKKRK